MAEFCLDCLNKLDGTNYTENEVWVDYEEWDLCEGCGKIKPCVINLYPKPIKERLLDLILKRKEKYINYCKDNS